MPREEKLFPIIEATKSITILEKDPAPAPEPPKQEEPHYHYAVTDPAVEPTCTRTGLAEGSHCSGCGVVLVEQKEIPPIPHQLTR